MSCLSIGGERSEFLVWLRSESDCKRATDCGCCICAKGVEVNATTATTTSAGRERREGE